MESAKTSSGLLGSRERGHVRQKGERQSTRLGESFSAMPTLLPGTIIVRQITRCLRVPPWQPIFLCGCPPNFTAFGKKNLERGTVDRLFDRNLFYTSRRDIPQPRTKAGTRFQGAVLPRTPSLGWGAVSNPRAHYTGYQSPPPPFHFGSGINNKH